jgi:hypothetical protein
MRRSNPSCRVRNHGFTHGSRAVLLFLLWSAAAAVPAIAAAERPGVPTDRLTEQVTIHNLTTASGYKPRTSPDPDLTSRVRMIEGN